MVIREAINAGSDVPLAKVPRGYDIGVMNAVDEGPGDGVTVYFDRLKKLSASSAACPAGR